MRKILIIFALLTTFLYSCGYRDVEGDKYPEIPFFPETTNNSIKIKRFHQGSLQSLPYILKDYVVFHTLEKDTTSKNKYLSKVLIYDKNQNLLKEEKVAASVSFIQRKNSENTLEIEYQDESKNRIRQNILIPSLKKSGRRIRYYEPKRSYFFSDVKFPEYDTTKYSAKEYNNIRKAFGDSIVQLYADSIISITEHNEVTFKDGSKRFYGRYFGYDQIPEGYLDSSKFIQVLAPNTNVIEEGCIKKYDDAVLGNRSYGNHMAFGYKAHGMVYYEINWNGEEAKTKYQNGGGLNSIHYEVQLFGKQFIYNTSSKILYRLKKN